MKGKKGSLENDPDFSVIPIGIDRPQQNNLANNTAENMSGTKARKIIIIGGKENIDRFSKYTKIGNMKQGGVMNMINLIRHSYGFYPITKSHSQNQSHSNNNRTSRSHTNSRVSTRSSTRCNFR